MTPIVVPSTGLLLFQFLVVILVLATAFGLARAWRGRSGNSRLAVVSLVCGPLMGLAAAGLYFALAEVSPLDVVHTLTGHVGVGLTAGLIGALIFEISCHIPFRVDPGSGKQGGITDDEV